MDRKLAHPIIITYLWWMNNRRLPNQEQLNYGQALYKEGYEDGYKRNTWDTRRRKALKEKALYLKYGEFLDFIDDAISKNRKSK